MSSEIKMMEGCTDRGRVLELARVCDARELEATMLRAWTAEKADDGEEGNKQLKDHRTGRRFDGATGLGFVISSAGRERKHAKGERGNVTQSPDLRRGQPRWHIYAR